MLSKLIDSKPTVLYIHGFSENLEKKSVKTVIQGILRQRDIMLILSKILVSLSLFFSLLEAERS